MKVPRWLWVAGGLGLLVWSRRGSATSPRLPEQSGDGNVLEADCVVSFYGPRFHGKQTANGEIFDQNALTAAHRTLPFNTRLRVTDLSNGRSVVVRVNDRGPFTKKDGSFARQLDLSVGAAAAIGLDIQRGLTRARIERV